MEQTEEFWTAIERRDAGYDGIFYMGVVTTGVYCRPSCPARRALRKNVRFYATPEAARQDGLRACLRCRPDAASATGAQAERIRDVCRYIDAHADAALSLGELAERAGLSRFHFLRRFKAVVGVTPKAYQEHARMRTLRTTLKASRDVTTAVYDAGFGSASRAYARAHTHLGMTPKEYRDGGAGIAITYAAVPSPLGTLMIAATDRGLCFVQFGETEPALREELEREYPRAAIEPMARPHHPQFDAWIDALLRHLQGREPQLDLPLDIRATAFQLRVWRYLQAIPYGEVRSYGEVARDLGNPEAARAVARACAANRVALVIPCHRVIRENGGLGGYRWGLERKRVLIDLERAARP